MSVSIETITARGRALGGTGTWGLETSLLLALAPGMGAKAHAQTCTQEVMARLGAQSKLRDTAAGRCGTCATESGRWDQTGEDHL